MSRPIEGTCGVMLKKPMENLILETNRLNPPSITTSDLEKTHELHSLHETGEFSTLEIPANISEAKKFQSHKVTGA